jgi:hypothetical protein
MFLCELKKTNIRSPTVILKTFLLRMTDKRKEEYVVLNDEIASEYKYDDKTKTNKNNVILRKVNLEEKSFFLLNIFYCFFCPFVCSQKILSDEDIPNCSVKDKTENIYPKIKKNWEKKYKKFIKEMDEYEKKKHMNNKLKSPKKPNLFAVLCGGLFSGSVVFALLLLLLRYLNYSLCYLFIYY